MIISLETLADPRFSGRTISTRKSRLQRYLRRSLEFTSVRTRLTLNSQGLHLDADSGIPTQTFAIDNPILIGHRWKGQFIPLFRWFSLRLPLEYHMALGPHLRDVPEESWKIFKEEKRQNMVSPSAQNRVRLGLTHVPLAACSAGFPHEL